MRIDGLADYMDYSPVKKGMPFTHPFCFGMGIHTQSNPNRVNRPFGADGWLMEFNCKGGMVCQKEDGESLWVGEGACFFYRPGIPQLYGIDRSAQKWEHYWTFFTPTGKLLEWLDWEEPFEGFGFLKIASLELRKKIKALFKEGIALDVSHYPHRQNLMENLLEQILLWLETENPRHSYRRLDGRIKKSLLFIDQNLGVKLGMEDLSHSSGLSRSRFGHLFYKTMGVSPLHYVEMRKMDWAGNLLRTTMDPVSAIARCMGYDDPLYFSRAFHKIKGVSPSAFRKGE